MNKSFIFLMLVGRWAQTAAVERNRRRLLTAPGRPDKVSVLTPGGSAVARPGETLQAGDIFELRSGQVVPVESQVETTAATFGTAWINGEAEPRECRSGARIPAGAVNLNRSGPPNAASAATGQADAHAGAQVAGPGVVARRAWRR